MPTPTTPLRWVPPREWRGLLGIPSAPPMPRAVTWAFWGAVLQTQLIGLLSPSAAGWLCLVYVLHGWGGPQAGQAFGLMAWAVSALCLGLGFCWFLASPAAARAFAAWRTAPATEPPAVQRRRFPDRYDACALLTFSIAGVAAGVASLLLPLLTRRADPEYAGNAAMLVLFGASVAYAFPRWAFTTAWRWPRIVAWACAGGWWAYVALLAANYVICQISPVGDWPLFDNIVRLLQ